MADLPPTTPPARRDIISVGVPGLDEILAGGLTRGRLYLMEGTPGTGKTTLGLQFLRDGVARGERGLYVTLSESGDELRANAASHGWSLDGIELYELVNDLGLDPDSEQSVLHPSELELGETVRDVIGMIDDLRPDRVVFDSLSELRLLAQNPLRYRRQVLAMKQMFAARGCTVMLLDEGTSEDVQLHSIAHGVIVLEQSRRGFGAARRRLHVLKMRGVKFHGGMHDFTLDTGGVEVFPSLVADDHGAVYPMIPASTGSPELDSLLGGGLAPATNTLLLGPSGVGKTTTAIRCMLSALQRGQRASYFLFDEGRQTMLTRARSLGMSLDTYLATGQLVIDEVEPAEFSPGEFTCRVRRTVEVGGAGFVVFDSLNAYIHAMPGEEYLVLQMHELLNYLNQKGVTTLLVLGQHGVVGDVRSDIDLSYLSDGILLFRYFEACGEVRTALSVLKSRVNAHERTIRELKLSPAGLQVGDALTDFLGVLSGLPTYEGDGPLLPEGAKAGEAP
jgi:circadian clock protein KaiC